MTISNTSRTAGPFLGNGVTTSFPFSYKVFDRADVLVAQTVTATGVETLKVLDADYSVTLNSDQDNNPGGVITMFVAPPAGTTLAATSNISLVQSLNLTNQGGFYPKVINDALDRVVMNIQQLSGKIGNGLGIGMAAITDQALAALTLVQQIGNDSGSSLVGFIQNVTGAVKRTVQDKQRDILHAKDFGVVGDGIVDDYPKFLVAINAARALGKILDVSDMKIYLASQSASINLDGVLLIRGSGKVPKPDIDVAYLNGADNALTVWIANRTSQGSAIFSRYNGPIFTGKTFPVQALTIFGDYKKAASSFFTQSQVTTYPGWSQALTADCSFSAYYCGADGIKLTGGLELCNLRNIDIWFCGGWCLNIGTTAGFNCPIEYLDIDATCTFIYGKQGNVWFNGYRRLIKMRGCLLNGPGQYDVQLAANPAFTVASQLAIVPAVRGTALAAGVYGGVNHNGSTQFSMTECYAEVTQNLLQLDGAPSNLVEFRGNSMLPWNNGLPKNLLSIQGIVYRLRTSGNLNIDGVFYIYIAPPILPQVADYLLEEATVSGGVSFVGAIPLDAALTPPPQWNQQSYTIGDGTAGTFTYNVAINQQGQVNNAVATAIWAISANFQDSQFDRNETVLMAVARVSSGNYVGQVLVPPATTNVFSAAPSISAAGVLQIPLTLYSRARVTRLDMQPLQVV